jgi:DNA-binding NarL/FixJ family response regulator
MLTEAIIMVDLWEVSEVTGRRLQCDGDRGNRGSRTGQSRPSSSSIPKIIFLNQESSAYMVQAALSPGVRGYVMKAEAARELLAAVEAVFLRKTFVSST